jgi:hypothetical protein
MLNDEIEKKLIKKENKKIIQVNLGNLLNP